VVLLVSLYATWYEFAACHWMTAMSLPFANMPFLRRNETAIPARTWNAWLRWRKRHDALLEMPLKARPGTLVLANDECWVLVDMKHGGAPLIMWLDFRPQERGDALHADVPCAVQFYDYPGARFHDAVIDEMTAWMEGALREER